MHLLRGRNPIGAEFSRGRKDQPARASKNIEGALGVLGYRENRIRRREFGFPKLRHRPSLKPSQALFGMDPESARARGSQVYHTFVLQPVLRGGHLEVI